MLKLSGAEGVGLHPQLRPLMEMYDEGLVGVVQGVGYPNPNRSHFKSMDIWHTADTTGTGDGWLGRYFDAECCGYGKGESGTPDGSTPQQAPGAGSGTGEMQGQPGIAIGARRPARHAGPQGQAHLLREPRPLPLDRAGHPRLPRGPYDELTRRESGEGQAARANSNAAFLMRTSLDAQVSSDLIRRAVRQTPLAQYPGNALGRDMAMVASMIRAGLSTRVYYVSLGGFDTHAGQGNQNGRHAQLLDTFATALRAFYQDLKASENDRRVLTMVFSEFGRRVAQNASGGTDHGTAAPMFLLGPMVKPGLVGSHPSLADLDEGDLKYQIDFRGVYATILEDWLSADSRAILEANYRRVAVLA